MKNSTPKESDQLQAESLYQQSLGQRPQVFMKMIIITLKDIRVNLIIYFSLYPLNPPTLGGQVCDFT